MTVPYSEMGLVANSFLGIVMRIWMGERGRHIAYGGLIGMLLLYKNAAILTRQSMLRQMTKHHNCHSIERKKVIHTFFIG